MCFIHSENRNSYPTNSMPKSTEIITIYQRMKISKGSSQGRLTRTPSVWNGWVRITTCCSADDTLLISTPRWAHAPDTCDFKKIDTWNTKRYGEKLARRSANHTSRNSSPRFPHADTFCCSGCIYFCHSRVLLLSSFPPLTVTGQSFQRMGVTLAHLARLIEYVGVHYWRKPHCSRSTPTSYPPAPPPFSRYWCCWCSAYRR